MIFYYYIRKNPIFFASKKNGFFIFPLMNVIKDFKPPPLIFNYCINKNRLFYLFILIFLPFVP